ncbi:hypothetical protein KSP40_PGU000660 [Platanthera guangdongensis]|uniref:Uncharacterized protein n=1 Tax=Platanthera guangdongensis TaxID=2320717 RepID=A0ABR2LKG4_9ASPA
MLQFPAFMSQFPSPPLIPSSTLLPLLASSHNDELLLAMEESELEDRIVFSLFDQWIAASMEFGVALGHALGQFLFRRCGGIGGANFRSQRSFGTAPESSFSPELSNVTHSCSGDGCRSSAPVTSGGGAHVSEQTFHGCRSSAPVTSGDGCRSRPPGFRRSFAAPLPDSPLLLINGQLLRRSQNTTQVFLLLAIA